MYKVYQRSVRQTETFKDLQRIKEETQKIDMNEMIFSIKPAGNLIQKLNYCVAQSNYIEVVFYRTEYEIWADFGPVGNYEKNLGS